MLLLLGITSSLYYFWFIPATQTDNYLDVIPDTLVVQEGDFFDLAIDTNLDFSQFNTVSSNLNTVRLEGNKFNALSGGTAFITVQSKDGSVQDQVLIIVNPLVKEEPIEELSFKIIVGDERFTFDKPVPISQLNAPPFRGLYLYRF